MQELKTEVSWLEKMSAKTFCFNRIKITATDYLFMTVLF